MVAGTHLRINQFKQQNSNNKTLFGKLRYRSEWPFNFKARMPQKFCHCTGILQCQNNFLGMETSG